MNLSDPLQVAAGTAWGEARGGGILGMQSVLNVVMNRAAHPRWWGSDVLGVCLAPWQFSCWNQADPNRRQILAVGPSDEDFAVALGLARRALRGDLPDITGGADSYYDSAMRRPPDWAARAAHTRDVAGQRFFRVELPAPGTDDPDAPNMRATCSLDIPPADQSAPPPYEITADELMAAELAADGDTT